MPRPKPKVEIKPYVPGQAIDPPQVIDPTAGPPERPLDQPPNLDEHRPPPNAAERTADQAAALGLSVEEYLALEPPLPGFAMQDEPFDQAAGTDPNATPEHEPDVPAMPFGGQALVGDLLPPTDPAPPPPTPPPGTVRYESRISIVEAWRYPGNLVGAPEWVDRNWIGFADFDDLRKIEPGPCLRVPIHGSADPSDVVLCRIGDYIARQEVKLTHDLPGEIQVQVWEADQFMRLFIPRS